MGEKIKQAALELLALLEAKGKLTMDEYILAQALTTFKNNTKAD
jgi:hypothetical protein